MPPRKQQPPPPKEAPPVAVDTYVAAEQAHIGLMACDTLDSLPLALTRHLSDLKELDAVLSSTLSVITEKVTELLKALEDPEENPATRLRLLMDLAEWVKSFKGGGDDKIRVVTGICETASKHATQMDLLASHLTATLPLHLTDRIPSSVSPNGYPSIHPPAPQLKAAALAAYAYQHPPPPPPPPPPSHPYPPPFYPEHPSVHQRQPLQHHLQQPSLTPPTHPPPPAHSGGASGHPPRTSSHPSAHPPLQQQQQTGPPRSHSNNVPATGPSHSSSHFVPPPPPPHAPMASASGAAPAPLHTSNAPPGRPPYQASRARGGERDQMTAVMEQRSGEGRRGAITVPSPGKDGLSEEAGDDQVYCYCQRVSFGEMIGCDDDSCEIEWFHLACAGLDAPPKGQWFCKYCRKKRQNMGMNGNNTTANPQKRRRANV